MAEYTRIGSERRESDRLTMSLSEGMNKGKSGILTIHLFVSADETRKSGILTIPLIAVVARAGQRVAPVALGAHGRVRTSRPPQALSLFEAPVHAVELGIRRAPIVVGGATGRSGLAAADRLRLRLRVRLRLRERVRLRVRLLRGGTPLIAIAGKQDGLDTCLGLRVVDCRLAAGG